MAQINKKGRTVYLQIDGSLYYKHSEAKVIYCRCKNKSTCNDRAITVSDGDAIIVRIKV